MTFFANAGVKWPTIESELRQAGTHALSGGAELWRLLSEVESWKSDRVTTLGDEEDTKNRCVDELQKAADTYLRNLKSIGDVTVGRLTSAELDLAALPNPYFFIEPPPYPADGVRFTTRDLYNDLIVRIRTLASQVKTLDLKSDRRDLSSQVFRAMREWELISSIARVIAVLNLRPDSSERVAR